MTRGVSKPKLRKGETSQSDAKAANSQEASAEKKPRPQHSECKFCQDGLCVNRVSLFYNQVREPDDKVCSAFQRRDNLEMRIKPREV